VGEKKVQELKRIVAKYSPTGDEPDFSEKLDEFLAGAMKFVTHTLTLVCLALGIEPEMEEFEEFTGSLIEDLTEKLNEAWAEMRRRGAVIG